MFGYLIAKNKFQTGTMRPVARNCPRSSPCTIENIAMIRLILTVIVSTACCNKISAQMISTHTMTSAVTINYDASGIIRNSQLTNGNITDSSSQLFAFPGPAYENASAFASVNLVASDLLHASSSMVANPYLGYGAGTTGTGIAGWRDFITYPGGGATPPTLRFNLGITGSISANGGTQSTIAILHGINSSEELESYLGATGLSVAGGASVSCGGNNLLSYGSSWDTINGSTDSLHAISGTTHIDVPYNPSTGGYRIAIVIYSESSDAYIGGIGTSDFSDTLSLNSISLTNGQIIDPANFTLESGISFQTTPEPSFAFGLAICLFIGITLLRRN